MPSVRDIAKRLQVQRQQAAQAYLASRRPHAFFQAQTRAVSLALCGLGPLFFPEGCCLLAVGGSGRGETYPHSDTDLVLVSPQAIGPGLQEQIAAFVQTLWDMGLAPALKSGTAAELCESAREDLTADTAFLEARFLCGDAGLAERFLQALNAQRHPAAFIEGKLLEMRQRHERQQGSGAVLEPNVKTCPGGLRDLHTMLWLAKAQGLAADPASLIAGHILTRAEAGILANSHKELAKIRIDLHLAAGRAEDRLVFDLQTRLAERMGIGAQSGRPSSELLMRAFYRAAKAVKQLNGIILPMLRGRVYSLLPRVAKAIDADYCQIGNQIAARDPALFQKHPRHIFTIISLLQQRGDLTEIEPQTLRAWWAATRKIDRRFYGDEANRRCFIGFFHHGGGLTHVMRFLNLYGVLGRYLPAWNKIVGLLQHDLFHIYPVDDHILTVLRNMRRLAMEQHVHELPFASALMNAFDKKYLLYLAALFHDIAKGRGGDHAVLGVADAGRFAADHFLPEEDGRLLCWLVENHLLMSMTAQKEDFQDPDVAARFCRRVQSPERLAALYLLTVSDIRGTNPKIWNSWKAGLLEGLFQTASRYFSGQTDSRAAVTGRRQAAASAALAAAGIGERERRRLFQALGAAYFVRHQESEILWHTAILAGRENLAAARIRSDPDSPDMLQIMVYLPNAPRLFAGLCRIFSRNNLDIAAARAFVTEHDYVLDTFTVRPPGGGNASDRARIADALMREMRAFLRDGDSGGGGSRTIPSRRARHLPIAPVIGLDAEEDQPGWYTLNLIAVNRPSLLADIADIFNRHGISLRHAKINTTDERAEDSFLLYSPNLADPNRQVALKKDLMDALAV
ncbi:MAG: [protein-PII] uridylyltransferase [Neisseria sp.]|nr:[protein-PII] uridylyltransferase [Neisseria sp.]